MRLFWLPTFPRHLLWHCTHHFAKLVQEGERMDHTVNAALRKLHSLRKPPPELMANTIDDSDSDSDSDLDLRRSKGGKAANR
jgi:hypothetical protein